MIQWNMIRIWVPREFGGVEDVLEAVPASIYAANLACDMILLKESILELR